MEFHEYANLFPMMTDKEFFELLTSMVRDGYHHNSPIVTYQGKILDGRNRYRAAETANILPMFVEFAGSDEQAYQFAKSNNLTRKHWTPDQLSVIALDIEAIEAKRAKERMLAGVKINPVPDRPQGSDKGKSRDKAGAAVGVSGKKVQRAKALRNTAPQLAEDVKNGKKTLANAEKEASTIRRAEQHAELVKIAETIPASDRWEVFAGDIASVDLKEKADAIITDPPYPKDCLPLWSELGKFAKRNLKEGGVLLAMTGDLYLPQILEMLGEHLTYQWVLACVLPGQHSEVHAAWVNNQMWKPILVYRNGGGLVNIGSDLFENGKRDKDFHEWGQGIGGYLWQVEHFTKPNDLICDPFLGGGTTAVAALKTSRRFVGFDIDHDKVSITKSRLGML